MIEAITKNTKMCEVKELLDFHGIMQPTGWEVAIGMLLNYCDYITVEGCGSDAQFCLHTED